MGRPAPHAPVSLIVGMLSASADLFDRAEAALSDRFGKPARASAVIPFDSTRYYEPEMGANLLRKFLAFDRPLDAADLVETKLWTNALEERLGAESASSAARPINLDPGYVTLAKLVLATTKDRAHRIYLGRGIYGEVTLTYLKGAFQPMPWTYPDYRTAPYRKFFEEARADLLGRSRARDRAAADPHPASPPRVRPG